MFPRKEAAQKLATRLLTESEIQLVAGADSHAQNGSSYTQAAGTDYTQLGNAGPYTQGVKVVSPPAN